MPLVLPSVGPSFSGLVYIGFFSGALRNHSRNSTSLRHSGVTPSRYRGPNSSGGAFQTRSRQSSVSRSNEAPAKVLRVTRLVRFGAAPDHTYFSGWAITGTPLSSTSPLTWWQREHWAMNVCSPSAASVPSFGGV